MDKLASLTQFIEAYKGYRKSKILLAFAGGELNISSLVEIQNAMDHLVRGLHNKEKPSDLDKGFKYAVEHIYRATFDNVDSLIFRTNQLVAAIVESRNTEILSDPEVKLLLEKIKATQEKLRGGTELNIVNIDQTLNELVDDTDVFEKLNQGYKEASSNVSRKRIYLAFLGFAIGIISGMIASTLFTLWK